MRGWKIVKPLDLQFCDIVENDITTNDKNNIKIKITKSLITLPDILRFNGTQQVENTILGSFGIGVVSENKNLQLDLEKGQHVYIEPFHACGECYNCQNGNANTCSNVQIAGLDYDGFLRDFVAVKPEMCFPLPESVSDNDALFINHISLATAVIDKLNIQKGDYVAVVGGNNFGNILCQLLIYYQAVPILLTQNDENYQIAVDSGIYYVLNGESDWIKEVSNITSGRMVNSVVYISDSNISAIKAFSVASRNASIAFTGEFYRNNTISFDKAIRKQLNIHCINNGFSNTASSINLLANKAINLSHLKINNATLNNVKPVFENANKVLKQDGNIYETIISLM